MANWLKTWLFLLLLSAQFALAGSVRVVITTDSALQPAVAEAVKRELAAQLTPAGIALDWVVLGEGDIYPHLGRTVQVVLKGRCVLPASPAPKPFAPGPFAETPVVDGQILSFSTIDCDRISRAVRRHRATKYWGLPWGGCWRTRCTTSSGRHIGMAGRE
jgi:hypothetical protein